MGSTRRSGKAASITVEGADDHTLAIKLTAPLGDFPCRIAHAGHARPSRRAATRCSAGRDGHTTGLRALPGRNRPVHVQGHRRAGPERPPTQRRRSAGTIPGSSMDLVRNPSYDPSTDGLRPPTSTRSTSRSAARAEVLANEVGRTATIDTEFGERRRRSELRPYSRRPDEGHPGSLNPTYGDYVPRHEHGACRRSTTSTFARR